jgi:hypothetical protein
MKKLLSVFKNVGCGIIEGIILMRKHKAEKYTK